MTNGKTPNKILNTSTPGVELKWEELSTTGLLWKINSEILHPLGFALSLRMQGKVVIGMKIVGDGSEPIEYEENINVAKAQAYDEFLHRIGARLNTEDVTA